MESERELKLADLRQKRLDFFQRNCFNKEKESNNYSSTSRRKPDELIKDCFEESQWVPTRRNDLSRTCKSEVENLWLNNGNENSAKRTVDKKEDLSLHNKTRTRRPKTRQDKMKHQRNTHHNKTNKDDIEKIKPSPRLQENVFDLDSLQKAARDGDDVLKKYIKELSTKMIDSQTGEMSNRPTTDNLDLHVLPSAHNDDYTNLFKLDAKDQDSSGSPREDDNNLFQSPRKRSDGRFDLNRSNSTDLESHRSYTSTIAESSDDHMQYPKLSLEVENRKSKYVPKISRPAIESSQLQKWGFYNDHESDLSMKEEEKLYHTFESDQNDFDLLTHRPNNRPYSPLVYSASYSESKGSESTRNSPSYDEFKLVTHRPATNSSNKLFERVDHWYESKSHSTFHESNKPSLSSDSNDSIDKFLKTGTENRRSTSPEQHMIGIWKYHQIEKQRRKSHKTSDDIDCPTIFHEELVATENRNSRWQHNQQESAFKISNWSSDDEDKKSSMSREEVMPLKRDDELCFESAPWRYSASPASPREYLTPKPEIELNDDMNDNVEDDNIQDCINQTQNVSNLQIRNTNDVDTEKPIFDFYDKQFNSLPLSRSPEPSVSHYHQVPKVKNNFENDIPSNDYVCVPSSAEIEDRKPPTLDLAFITDDNNQHEPGGEIPFPNKIIDSDPDVRLQVPAEKKKQSTSPLNSRKKTANRLLGRGQSQKQRWSTSSSLPSSVLATRVSSLLSSSLKDRKTTGSGKEVSRNKHREGNSAEKLKTSHQKKVINGNFFTVTPANMSTDFNLISQKECIPPLTLQLLSDSPRGGEGLSIWQLLPDELLYHICTYLSPSSLAVVAQVCQTFHRIANDELLWKTITLKKKELTDDWLIQIGEKRPTDISLLQCNGSKVTEDGLRTMFRTCSKSLKKLNVSGSTGGDLIGDSILLHASRCVKLTSLDVSWCSVTNNGLVSIGESIEKLQVLCLNGCQAITDDSINMVLQKHCKSINVLELFGCFNISPAVISQVGKLCKHLHTLNVGQCYKMTDDDMVTMVTHLEHVLNLDMRGCKQMHDTTVRKLVRSCKKLKSISLANCGHLTDASLIEISTYLPTIKMIDVSGCKKITNQGVHSLAKSSYNLSSLDLSSTSVNYKSISSLSSYCGKSLRSLKLNFCKDVTEKSVLKLLQNCHRLEVLQLYGVKGLRNLSSIKSQFPALKFD